jgi:hypothetical protein
MQGGQRATSDQALNGAIGLEEAGERRVDGMGKVDGEIVLLRQAVEEKECYQYSVCSLKTSGSDAEIIQEIFRKLKE